MWGVCVGRWGVGREWQPLTRQKEEEGSVGENRDRDSPPTLSSPRPC